MYLDNEKRRKEIHYWGLIILVDPISSSKCQVKIKQFRVSKLLQSSAFGVLSFQK